MMSRHLGRCTLMALVLMALVLMPATAFALSQQKHADITRGACDDAGLPREFCIHVGRDAYHVDADEFNDTLAHAQIPDGMDTCAAANAVMARVYGLARQADAAIKARNWVDAAVAVGRASHTIQDNCTHFGMPNPEHAWYAMLDVCDGTKLSPDRAPAAVTCAKEETKPIFSAFRGALASARLTTYDITDIDEGFANAPNWADVCAFLAESHDWDGTDRSWDLDVMRKALRDAFVRGIVGLSAPGDVCGGEPEAIFKSYRLSLTTNTGPAQCPAITIYCQGRADQGDVPPDFSDMDTTAAAPQPEAAGCTLGGVPASSAPVLLLVAVALLVVRRRRRAA